MPERIDHETANVVKNTLDPSHSNPEYIRIGDLEVSERSKSIIRRLWNPTMPQNPENNKYRDAVLYAIAQTAYKGNLDHQAIADAIYGAGQVSVERYLKNLYTEVEQKNDGFHIVDKNISIWKLALRVTQKTSVDASIFFDRTSGKYGLTIYQTHNGIQTEEYRFPNYIYANFDQAHQEVLRTIQQLRQQK